MKTPSLVLAFVLILIVVPASAQYKTAEVDKIFSWVTPGMPGCAAAASQDGKLLVNRAYGLADLERNVPLSTDSVFDAGSIRKQFVAAAVLVLVEEGKFALFDDVRRHVPELADFGHTITIDHLLTHTSGIRDWVPLLNWASGDPDAMTMILRQRTLNFVPGTEWSYSNSGYVLLPEIVARTSGMKFSEFLHKRVLDPLGMKQSRYIDDPRVVIRNRALAYEKQGAGWVMDMLLENDRGGSGALFTTASDLVIWTDALANGRLGKLVSAKIQEPATLSNGRKLTYARGLMLQTNYGGTLVWHGGSAAAYKSVVGRFADHGISVAVLCNAGEAADGRTAFAGRIFDLFMADKGLRRGETPPPPAGVTGVDVSGRAGLFFNERTNEPIRLAASGGRLAIAGGGPLVTLAADRFRIARPSTDFMSNDELELHFLSNDQFELTSMEGATSRYRRGQPYSPTAADLKALAGRYESHELHAVLEITPGKEGLMVRLNDARQLGPEFKAVDRDTFQVSSFTLRFVRDAAGKVAGLELTNPVFRKVRFGRL
ncbi:MAG: serine hydrolase [Acidobacteriota bacterium]|nr:serine hydrolase [Acidobacteriota bacterium]